MSKRGIILSIVLFLLLVVGMFSYTFLKSTELEQMNDVSNDTVVTDDANQRGYMPDDITAKHFFIDGVHTLVGDIPLSTPCDLLEWNAFVAESYPEQVRIDYSTLNTSEDCIQVITSQRFKVTFTASADADISARFNTNNIPLNLIPAAPGETPDNFDVFIKG